MNTYLKRYGDYLIKITKIIDININFEVLFKYENNFKKRSTTILMLCEFHTGVFVACEPCQSSSNN